MLRTIARCLPVAALAAVNVPAHAQQPQACTASAYQQFDFWVGEWNVTTADGAVAGTNSIRKILGGCVLQENWRGSSGSVGTSYNIYDFRTGQWHQTWVDNSGLLLQLDGELVDGKMVLRGETQGGAGATTLNEVSWEPLDGGRVRQVWRTSTDDGQTWTTVFDGLYAQQ